MGELEVGVEFAQPQTDDTTAAVTVSSFHVDPVVDQNTVAVPGCAVRTGRGRGGGFDSRHDEPLNSRTSSLRTAAMQSGVSAKPLLGRWLIYILVLLMLDHLCLAAPGQPGTQRAEAVDTKPSGAPLANPFSSAEEDRRLLQSFIHSSVKEGEMEPELNTWEQEVFLLLRLFDFDRSGFLDGLELMKLLSDYNAHHGGEAQASEQLRKVVSMVDFLLQTQDLNQDGLLAPSELLSPPLPQSQDAENLREPQQKEEEEEVVNSNPHQEVPAEQQEQEEQETHVDAAKPQEGEQVEVEEEEQAHAAPVHQGQPEI